MLLWLRSEAVRDYVRKHLVYCSLMFVALNPLADEADDEENDTAGISAVSGIEWYAPSTPTASSDDAAYTQKAVEYYKLGKLYLMQGNLVDSYKAFRVGEQFDDMGTMQQAAFLGHAQPLIESEMAVEPTMFKEQTINEYLAGLITLYL